MMKTSLPIASNMGYRIINSLTVTLNRRGKCNNKEWGYLIFLVKSTVLKGSESLIFLILKQGALRPYQIH